MQTNVVFRRRARRPNQGTRNLLVLLVLLAAPVAAIPATGVSSALELASPHLASATTTPPATTSTSSVQTASSNNASAPDALLRNLQAYQEGSISSMTFPQKFSCEPACSTPFAVRPDNGNDLGAAISGLYADGALGINGVNGQGNGMNGLAACLQVTLNIETAHPEAADSSKGCLSLPDTGGSAGLIEAIQGGSYNYVPADLGGSQVSSLYNAQDYGILLYGGPSPNVVTGVRVWLESPGGSKGTLHAMLYAGNIYDLLQNASLYQQRPNVCQPNLCMNTINSGEWPGFINPITGGCGWVFPGPGKNPPGSDSCIGDAGSSVMLNTTVPIDPTNTHTPSSSSLITSLPGDVWLNLTNYWWGGPVPGGSLTSYAPHQFSLILWVSNVSGADSTHVAYSQVEIGQSPATGSIPSVTPSIIQQTGTSYAVCDVNNGSCANSPTYTFDSNGYQYFNVPQGLPISTYSSDWGFYAAVNGMGDALDQNTVSSACLSLPYIVAPQVCTPPIPYYQPVPGNPNLVAVTPAFQANLMAGDSLVGQCLHIAFVPPFQAWDVAPTGQQQVADIYGAQSDYYAGGVDGGYGSQGCDIIGTGFSGAADISAAPSFPAFEAVSTLFGYIGSKDPITATIAFPSYVAKSWSTLAASSYANLTWVPSGYEPLVSELGHTSTNCGSHYQNCWAKPMQWNIPLSTSLLGFSAFNQRYYSNTTFPPNDPKESNGLCGGQPSSAACAFPSAYNWSVNNNGCPSHGANLGVPTPWADCIPRLTINYTPSLPFPIGFINPFNQKVNYDNGPGVPAANATLAGDTYLFNVTIPGFTTRDVVSPEGLGAVLYPYQWDKTWPGGTQEPLSVTGWWYSTWKNWQAQYMGGCYAYNTNTTDAASTDCSDAMAASDQIGTGNQPGGSADPFGHPGGKAAYLRPPSASSWLGAIPAQGVAGSGDSEAAISPDDVLAFNISCATVYLNGPPECQGAAPSNGHGSNSYVAQEFLVEEWPSYWTLNFTSIQRVYCANYTKAVDSLNWCTSDGTNTTAVPVMSTDGTNPTPNLNVTGSLQWAQPLGASGVPSTAVWQKTNSWGIQTATAGGWNSAAAINTSFAQSGSVVCGTSVCPHLYPYPLPNVGPNYGYPCGTGGTCYSGVSNVTDWWDVRGPTGITNASTTPPFWSQSTNYARGLLPLGNESLSFAMAGTFPSNVTANHTYSWADNEALLMCSSSAAGFKNLCDASLYNVHFFQVTVNNVSGGIAPSVYVILKETTSTGTFYWPIQCTGGGNLNSSTSCMVWLDAPKGLLPITFEFNAYLSSGNGGQWTTLVNQVAYTFASNSGSTQQSPVDFLFAPNLNTCILWGQVGCNTNQSSGGFGLLQNPLIDWLIVAAIAVGVVAVVYYLWTQGRENAAFFVGAGGALVDAGVGYWLFVSQNSPLDFTWAYLAAAGLVLFGIAALWFKKSKLFLLGRLKR